MVDILDDDFLMVPVRQTGGTMHTITTSQSPATSVSKEEKMASDVVVKSQWKEEREQVRSRALDILIAHFAENKSAVETRGTLMQPFEKGGAGMTPQEANAFVEAIASVSSQNMLSGSMSSQVASQPTQQSLQTKGKASNTPQTTKPPVNLPVQMSETEVQVVKPIPLPVTTKQVASSVRSEKEKIKEKVSVSDSRSEVKKNTSEVTKNEQKKETVVQTKQPPAISVSKDGVKSSDSSSINEKNQEKIVVKENQVEQSSQVSRALPSSREEAITMLTNEIMQALSFRLPDQYSNDRLRYIINARLREIRDWGETEEVLAKPLSSGGLGLGRLDIEKVHVELEERVREIEQMVAEKQKTDVRVALQIEKKNADVKKEEKKREDAKEVETVFKQVVNGGLVKDAPVVKPLSAPSQPTGAITQKTMTDIRPPQSTLVGPVEELRRMTLVDFRKLSSDPKEAVRKIQDKFALLEQQSFGQKLAGMRALKESEVYTIYFTMVRASVMKGIPITTVIHDRSGEALPVLTEEEFSAIMELSRELRA